MSAPPEPKVGVITMVQRRDLPEAEITLGQIRGQLDERSHHFVLLNDERDPIVERDIGSGAQVTVLTPGRNVGVASGRNLLIEAALDWGADLIVSLDDDLYLASDHLAVLRRAWQRLERDGARTGVLGSTVLDYRSVVGLAGGQPPDRAMTSEQLRDTAAAAVGSPEAFYHLGIQGWRQHYLFAAAPRAVELRTFFARALGRTSGDQGEQGELRRLDWAQREPFTGDGSPFPIDTAAGGVCAIPAALIRDIGPIDDRFSPFGYEDADFCIRARRRGYQNYWIPRSIVLHDIAGRAVQRDTTAIAAALGRSRPLLAVNHLDDDEVLSGFADHAALVPVQLGNIVRHRGGGQTPQGKYLAAMATYFSAYVGAARTGPPGQRWIDRVLRAAAAAGAEVRSSMSDGRRSIAATWLGGTATQPGERPGLRGGGSIRVEFDDGADAVRLGPISVDIPGLFQLRIDVTLHEVSGRDPALGSLSLRITDTGLLALLAERAGEDAKETTASGYLGSLARPGRSEIGHGLRAFWSRPRQARTLTVEFRPNEPVACSRLAQQEDLADVQRIDANTDVVLAYG